MATVLSPIQMQLLQIFQYQRDEKELEEMRDVLLRYLHAKMDREVEKACKEKGITVETVEGLKNAHFRTPYKQ
jgi:hypothetical protein